MGLFKREYHCPGYRTIRQAPEGYYRGNDPRLCCVIRLADAQVRLYPQWVQKALYKSDGNFYACAECWAECWGPAS